MNTFGSLPGKGASSLAHPAVSQPVFRATQRCLRRINKKAFTLMRLSPRVAVVLCLSGLLCGCPTTQELLTKVQNVAVAVFNNPSVGAYRATLHQVRLADQRATVTFDPVVASRERCFQQIRHSLSGGSDQRPYANATGGDSQEYGETGLKILRPEKSAR